MLGEFKDLPVWCQYDTIKKVEFPLEMLASKALSLMDHYYKAFPKYTLHNRQHQKNVLRLIGELLGKNINLLTELECIILILSVCYHDVGMVFDENDLQKISSEQAFEIFLNENFKARLEYNENSYSINKSIAEWYCRWVHAKRVWMFLDDFDANPYQSKSLRTVIGNICESHNMNVANLNDIIYDVNFSGKADLRFCAILLRLGDILDFDNSRTPASVYEFLDLDNPKNKSDLVSKEEWNKHLCSDGFTIQHLNETNIYIRFDAGPKHPQIEKNIQTFLNVIEDELKGCSTIITTCSTRFKDFRLPSEIDRSGINPQNYSRGDFSLTLDEGKIIKLLTGENLYNNEFVFIRELLQNAIDSSRMREFHELSSGVKNFKASPILITEWIDEEGFQWVRVDDYGMGVNKYIVVNHLLKKGQSYYNSDYFKIQKNFYKEKTGKDFTPISRFGIGLLSCFILGDAIEISSRSKKIAETKAKEDQIRLSIQGLHGQYILQIASEQHKPEPMPSFSGMEKGYRSDFGVSIAVRINKSKNSYFFKALFKDLLNEYVTCTPVKINFSGENLGVELDRINDKLSSKEYKVFDNNSKTRIEEFIGESLTTDIGLEFLPINLTSNSLTQKLKGQIIFIYLKCDHFGSKFPPSLEIRIEFRAESKLVEFIKKIKNQDSNKEEEKHLWIDCSKMFQEAINQKNFTDFFVTHFNKDSYKYPMPLLIHNGINIPNYSDSRLHEIKLKFDENLFRYYNHSYHRGHFAFFGIIYFQDNLLPDLSVSRNVIKKLKFNIYSNLFHATRELNNSLSDNHLNYNYISNIDEFFSYEDIIDDELVKMGHWNSEKFINSSEGLVSLNEIKEFVKTGEVRVSISKTKYFLSSLIKGLIQLNFNVEYVVENGKESYLSIKSIIKEEEGRLYKFNNLGPLLIVPFNDLKIVSNGEFINQNHSLVKWLVLNQQYLFMQFEGYCINLIYFMLNRNIAEANHVLNYFRKILKGDIIVPKENLTEADYISLTYP